MDPKPWYKSKTLWFNVINGALPLIAANVDVFKPLMTPTVFASFTSYVMFGNLVLRIITNIGIKFFEPTA